MYLIYIYVISFLFIEELQFYLWLQIFNVVEFDNI